MTFRGIVLVVFSLAFAIATPGYAQTISSDTSSQTIALAKLGVFQDHALWLPLASLKTLGIAVALVPQRDEVFVQHNGNSVFIAESFLKSTPQGPALGLSTLTSKLGLNTVRVGKQLYLIAEPSTLRAVNLSENGFQFEFSGFVPVETATRSDGVSLTFYNVDTARSQDVILALGDVAYQLGERYLSVQLSGAAGSPPTLSRHLGPQSFSVSVHWESGGAQAPLNLALSEGVTYQSLRVPTPAGLSTIHLIKAQDVEREFALRPLLPSGGIGTLESLEAMARQPGVVAAINANFFDPASKHPIGLLLDHNQLLQEDHARRGALAVDTFGKLHFLTPGASATLSWNGERLDVSGLNRPLKINELVAFGPDYGQSIPLPGLSTVVRIVDDRIQSVITASVLNPDRASSYVVATGDRRDQLKGWQRRDVVRLTHTVTPAPGWPIKHAISAGPMLVLNGQIVLDTAAEAFSDTFASARAARSAVAISADGALMFAIVLQNDQSAGMTLAELAGWIQAQGASNALALDGGGSSSLVLKTGVRWRHWGGARPIAVGLALIVR